MKSNETQWLQWNAMNRKSWIKGILGRKFRGWMTSENLRICQLTKSHLDLNCVQLCLTPPTQLGQQ